LHDRLLTLPDATRVFPAHGAGSACGKHMSSAAESTVGEQRATNYALAAMSEDEFVDVVTQGQSVAPLYFAYAADSNRRTHALLDDEEPPATLDLATIEALLDDSEILFIDARSPDSFASGHLRGATSIIERMLSVRPDLAEPAVRIPATDLAAWRAESPGLQLVDVRNPAEQQGGIIEGARPLPLPRLLASLGDLDPTVPTIVYCAGGYRSAVAASLLRAKGFRQVADILGGYDAWHAAGLPTVSPPVVAADR
jgi:hydroxyacylglutathione hydrolase